MIKYITIAIIFLATEIFGQSNITQGEYFFDSDPGIGLGTSIPGVISSSSIDLNFFADISSLSLGSHTLGLRFMDDNGDWTITQYQTFWILISDPLTTENVAGMEYFFDVDPGLGQGTSIPITASISLDINDVIDASTLSPGLHTLYVRARSVFDEWSMPESAIVFVSANDPNSIATIDQLEYFIDDDPGVGNGTAITFTSGSSLDFNELVDTSTLPVGNHTFNLRARTASGEWSIVKIAPFYIDFQEVVTELEHFVDADPGFGNGTIQPLTLQGDTASIDLVIPTASLPIGPHTMNARIGDSNSGWGMTESAPFILCDGAIAAIVSSRVCEGDVSDFTDLSTNVLAGDIYSWDFDGDGNEDSNTAGDQTFSFNAPGIYPSTLTIDRLGCPGISTVMTVVDTLVTLSGTVANTVDFGSSGSAVGQASGTVASVLWTTDGSGSFDDPTQLTSNYIPSIQDGVVGNVNLTLSAVHPGACTIQPVSFSMQVTLPPNLEITVYNAVSPNNDGKHDFMEIENIEAFPTNSVVIFNRWGDVVTTINGYDNDQSTFTGNVNGKLLPAGTYYYEIDLGNGSDLIKGFLTISY